jgi:magnesium chelatase subunit I
MEEQDVQIRGYRVRLSLDILLVASANPEDYTNRGRIITPLKDRYGSQIRTHYPTTLGEEIRIMDAERRQFPEDEIKTCIPQFMKEIIAEVTHLARKSPDINQNSGVSVRVSIANYETVISNAVRRAAVLKEKTAVPRVCDLSHIHCSTAGKIEMESNFEDAKAPRLIDDLIEKAVLNVFNHHCQIDALEPLVAAFDRGLTIEVSEMLHSQFYLDVLKKAPALEQAIRPLNGQECQEAAASAMEFILEGLYANRRLSKTRLSNKSIYER